MAEHQQDQATLTFAEAIGRVFSFKWHGTAAPQRFYVCKGIKRYWVTPTNHEYQALVIDLETSQQIVIYDSRLDAHIPMGWKEILP